MNHFETILSSLILLFEILLCGFVFARNVHRILPLFALYMCVLLIDTVGVLSAYKHFGFYSTTAYFVYWVSIVVNATARSLAIVELCRFGLRAYRGIWALV